MKKDMDRRTFLQGIGAMAAAGSPLLSWAQETPLRVAGYRGLAKLPYFTLDRDGRLRCTVKDLPPGVDFHAHLGISLMFAPRLDLLRETPRTRYIFDLDEGDPPVTLDLERYVNRSATAEMHRKMERQFKEGLTKGSPIAATHTIPNLLREMDAMSIDKAVILSIKVGVPFRDDLAETWGEAIRRSGRRDRFILFGSVHPQDQRAVERLRHQKEKLGIRGVKLHPSVGRYSPADPKMTAIYAECQKLDLPVFWHTGSAGIGPKATQAYSDVPGYEEPVRSFPKVRFVFGHGGNRQWEKAIPIEKKYPNVWVDTHGLGVTALRRVIREVGPDRLFFGSDWPWYPLAVHMAKVLHVTRGDKSVRNKILSENARSFLGIR